MSGLVATDPRAAGQTVDRLSEFCQLALKGATDELRSLGDELEIIRAYLDVEQAGAGESLLARIETAPAALPCLMPPLLLQPLVENALKYGGQTSPDRLDIVLTARLDADGRALEIEIANTGRWVERDTRTAPRAAVGIANVTERLAHFDRSGATLTFAHDGHWVRALLRLPARTAPAKAAV